MEKSDCFLMNSRMAAVVREAEKYDKKKHQESKTPGALYL
jgi:hypothetical protein